MLASTRSHTGMFDIDESSNIFKDPNEILIKQEENEISSMDKTASGAVKAEIFDPTLLASARSYNGMFDTDKSSNIFKDLDEILIKQEENGDEVGDDQSVGGKCFVFLQTQIF